MTVRAPRGAPSRSQTARTRSRPSAIADGGSLSWCSSHAASVVGIGLPSPGRGVVGTSGLARVDAGDGRGLLREQGEQRGDLVAHLAAIDDEVERAVLEQELAALEAFGQRLAYGLLD